MNVAATSLRSCAVILAVSFLHATASLAATVTFDTGPHTAFGGSFTGSVTENGYTYSTLSGSLFLSAFGNPGQTMEGNEEFGGGVLNIASASASNFSFSQLDFSAFGATPGSETITVTGLLNGLIQGTDSFTLTDTSVFNPTYSNWTTEFAFYSGELRILRRVGGGPHSCARGA